VTNDEKRLRELLTTVTPGPWTTSSEYSVRDADGELAASVSYEEREQRANAEFIALARNLLPTLLAELDALRGVEKAARDAETRLGQHIDHFSYGSWDLLRGAIAALDAARRKP
jgi:hypothetical protein